MSQQMFVGRVAHAAGVAQERADSLVAVHVAVKSLLPGEGLLAVVAGQGVDLIVGLHLMASQVVLLNELLPTGLKQGDLYHPLFISLSIMYLNTGLPPSQNIFQQMC